MGYTDHSQPPRAAAAAKPSRLHTEQTYVHWVTNARWREEINYRMLNGNNLVRSNTQS
jgi:hypothetical protein